MIDPGALQTYPSERWMQRAAGLWAVVVIMTFGRLTPTRQRIPAFTHFAGLPNFGNVKRIDILNVKMYIYICVYIILKTFYSY